MFEDNENLDELLNAYSSKADIQNAMKEKAKGELEVEESTGEKIKNYPKPQRELDLHGKTGIEAKRDIEWFLGNARNQKIQPVRIIYGKGLHSPNLKSVLPQIAEQKIVELKKEGLVFSFKKEKTGGSILVYLA